MNFLDYALHHVACTARLLRGDIAALDEMDISADGFWRSFEAIPASLPALMFAWVAEARQLQADGTAVSLGSMILRMAVLELAFWIVPVIALAFVLKALGMMHRFTHLVVARNWLAALVSYLFVIVPLSGLLDAGNSSLPAMLTLGAIGLMLWFSVRVTRAALNTPLSVAVTFVAVEAVITYPLAVFAYAAAGLYPAV